jgi:hypothetical protein
MNRPTYDILERRQTWRLYEGQWMRECVARRSDGQLRLLLVRDEVAA